MRLRFLSKASFLLLLASIAAFPQKPELVVQAGHSLPVYSVAFSPDGKTLASGSQDKTVKLWEVATGTELRTFKGHADAIMSIAFSPDGKTLASGSWDKTVKLWDVASAKELRTFKGHAGEIWSIAFSPDGKTLASGSRDQTVKLWDVATGTDLRTFKGHSGDVSSIAFSADGKTLASGSWDKTVKAWEVSTGTELRTFKGDSSMVSSIIFSPDGKTLASGSWDKAIKLWDVATATELRTFKGHSAEVTSIAFSPDGRTLASGAEDKTVKLWNVSNGAELRTLEGHSSWVYSVAFSPDGMTLASGSDRRVRQWEVATGKELAISKAPSDKVSSIAFSPDGKTLASGSWDQTVKLWEVATDAEPRTLRGHSHWIMSIAFGPGGKTLASGSWDQTVKLWDIATGTELRTFKGHTKDVLSIAFSPDGRMLASGSYDETVRLWEVATGTTLLTLRGHSRGVMSIAFSPDGKVLASGSLDKTVKLWDVASGTELRTFKNYSGTVMSLAFGPNGKTLAGGTSDQLIKIWDVATAKEVRVLKGHTDEIDSITFSPDGMMLASGSRDQTVKLWNFATGKELRTFTGHSSIVNSVAFSPDGKTLGSGSWDSYLKLWRVTDGAELVSLIAFGQRDWLVVTPEGLFDGSSNGWRKILWRFNGNTFDHAPVEAFFKEFYYPGLLQEIMAGRNPKPPVKNLSEVDVRQPSVDLTRVDQRAVVANALGEPLTLPTAVSTRSAEIEIQVTDNANAPSRADHPPTSGANDLRLFRNGSLVKLWPGDVFGKQSGCEQITTKPGEPRRAVCKATVSVIAGNNNLTAYAFNHENVKSNDSEALVRGVESLKTTGTLHILAVGISQYANREYNLNYTTDDATSLASQLQIQQDKLGQYQSVEIKTLLNENATKANVLAELKQLAGKVQPEDAVVVYFSGHGKASGDHFYLVPHDLGYTGSRDELSDEGLQQLLAHSISDLELEEAFRGIDAGQMFMIIDACNSGQALENKDEPRRGPMNTRGLAQLAYEKGMYIMTASQNVEDAFVSERLKHSYLTYALVEEGLKTKAADADHNGEVVLREWFDYALARVPKLREEVLQPKSLEEVTPNMKAARSQKSQTPRVFYRREVDVRPLIVANVRASK